MRKGIVKNISLPEGAKRGLHNLVYGQQEK